MTLTQLMSSLCLDPGWRNAPRAMALAAVVICALVAGAIPGSAPLAAEISPDLRIDFGSIAVSRAELMCLAENDYWEARSESIAGRIAVARVVLNRAMDRRFPRNLCDVVKQTSFSGTSMRCQFSWYCQQKVGVKINPKAWRDSLKVAAAVLQKDSSIPDPTGGALWYHASFVLPAWSNDYEATTIIGDHVFYREPDNRRRQAAQRKPFIYRLNAYAEYVAARRGRSVTVAMAPQAVALPTGAVSSVAVKDDAVSAQPLMR